MLQTIFEKGISWEAMPPSRTRILIDRDDLLQHLAAMRAELEREGDLLQLRVSAGLLLADFCEALQLDPEGRRQVLGDALAEVTK